METFLSGLFREDFVRTLRNGMYKGCGDCGTFPDDRDGPGSIEISVTGRCNLECLHCFYSRERHERKDLDTAQWLSFFHELGSLGVRDVTLTGGEVFMRPDVWDIIDGLISNRMRYSLLTNGTLLTEQTLSAFELGKRSLRLNSVQVSIDGSCPEVHDRLRGRGAFAKALRGLRLAGAAGLPVTSRVTVNRFNMDDLENIARLLIEDVGIDSFSTNEVMPMGAGCCRDGSLRLSPKEELKVMRVLSELENRYNGRVTAMAGPLAKWKSYRAMEEAKASGRGRSNMGCLNACGGVFSKLAVHHDGAVSPCHLLPNILLGRINRDSIREIWTSHPTLEGLRRRGRIPMAEVEGCEDCSWAPYCKGGCPGVAQETLGEVNRANPQDCYRSFCAATGGVTH
jgi:SynChlorMet cassette radical SAM/SPASM protein ScmE